MTKKTRTEHDSMGALEVPEDALWGAQTQRAVENFPISGMTMPRGFIRALGLIKAAAARSNQSLELLDKPLAKAIRTAAIRVADGEFDEHFPVDVFQTGSGTSSNMNVNEVIANLVNREGTVSVHPNDHVNMGQSSNDVIPTAIQVSACLAVTEDLLPAMLYLRNTLDAKADSLAEVVKTGRTHLMDAMPLTFGQELHTWSSQIESGIERIEAAMEHLKRLPQGGTAVGTGINAHPEFGPRVARALKKATGIKFTSADHAFEGIASQDAAVAMSGQLRTLACSLMKMANDLRLMNSGPLAGLGDIELPALQPGSSIMPGKVNPVIPEAVCMVCAQVMGNDAAIAVGGQAGNFQLNVMLPMVAQNLLQSIGLLSNACRLLADSAIAGFTVREDRIAEALERNPILVTALNPVIGYEKGAEIAKRAYAEGRSVREVALEMTDLSAEELDRLLDPLVLTRGGLVTGSE